jgi:hypothetical protein
MPDGITDEPLRDFLKANGADDAAVAERLPAMRNLLDAIVHLDDVGYVEVKDVLNNPAAQKAMREALAEASETEQLTRVGRRASRGHFSGCGQQGRIA